VAAVRATGTLVVRYGSRVVQAFYSSSSGGYTSSNAQWGSSPLPWFPGRSDEPYDRGGGGHPNPSYRLVKEVSAASLGARLGSAPRWRSPRPRCRRGGAGCRGSGSAAPAGR
jgi:peptidoglycan hydrolase-like amidase